MKVVVTVTKKKVLGIAREGENAGQLAIVGVSRHETVKWLY
jgi:hypothetical protein